MVVKMGLMNCSLVAIIVSCCLLLSTQGRAQRSDPGVQPGAQTPGVQAPGLEINGNALAISDSAQKIWSVRQLKLRLKGRTSRE
jgi:hypothetical protein